MLEQPSRFTGQEGGVEAIFHDETNVHIVRFYLSRDERPENDESPHLTGRLGDGVNPLKAPPDSYPLSGARSETLQHLPPGSGMHSERQVSAVRKGRYCHNDSRQGRRGPVSVPVRGALFLTNEAEVTRGPLPLLRPAPPAIVPTESI